MEKELPYKDLRIGAKFKARVNTDQGIKIYYCKVLSFLGDVMRLTAKDQAGKETSFSTKIIPNSRVQYLELTEIEELLVF